MHYQPRAEEQNIPPASLTAARADVVRLEGALEQLRAAHGRQVQDLQHQLHEFRQGAKTEQQGPKSE